MSKSFHGSSISNLIGLLSANPETIYVTDTAERAARYANAQATGRVSKEFSALAENAALLEIETANDVKFITRPAEHNTLDDSEARVTGWRIVRVTLRKSVFPHTLYGGRGNRMSADDLERKLRSSGIEVVVQ